MTSFDPGLPSNIYPSYTEMASSLTCAIVKPVAENLVPKSIQVVVFSNNKLQEVVTLCNNLYNNTLGSSTEVFVIKAHQDSLVESLFTKISSDDFKTLKDKVDKTSTLEEYFSEKLTELNEMREKQYLKPLSVSQIDKILNALNINNLVDVEDKGLIEDFLQKALDTCIKKGTVSEIIFSIPIIVPVVGAALYGFGKGIIEGSKSNFFKYQKQVNQLSFKTVASLVAVSVYISQINVDSRLQAQPLVTSLVLGSLAGMTMQEPLSYVSALAITPFLAIREGFQEAFKMGNDVRKTFFKVTRLLAVPVEYLGQIGNVHKPVGKGFAKVLKKVSVRFDQEEVYAQITQLIVGLLMVFAIDMFVYPLFDSIRSNLTFA